MSWHDTLADAWRSVVTNTTEPGTHPRDLAASLGRTEAELLAAGTPETGVRRLQPDWPALLHALPEVGEVMVLTRNEHAVHEKTGRFGNIRGMGNTMLVLNDAIDLRLFTSAWRHGFDVTVPARGTERRSIQIFDRHGDAVLKIYRTQATNSDAFDALCRRFHAPDLEGPLALEPRPALDAPRPDDEVDLEGLRSGWEGLTDVHKFRQLLKDTGADRHQALRLIGRKFAEEVQPDALSRVLSLAASQAEPIMVFVGQPGLRADPHGPR